MDAQMTLHRTGECAPADLYRDVLSGREVALPADSPLPPGPEGIATVYVHLESPRWLRAVKEKPMVSEESRGGAPKKTELPVTAPSGIAETLAGACGRTIVRGSDADGRLMLIVEPTEGRRLPCSKCRAKCPGQSIQAAG